MGQMADKCEVVHAGRDLYLHGQAAVQWRLSSAMLAMAD